MMKKVLSWLFKLLLFLLLAVLIAVAMNFTFLKRGLTYPAENEITNSAWYTPKAAILGDNRINYKISDSISIAPKILEEISAYAKSQNSSALLVSHKGELQLEEHWQGSDRQSITNSMSMSKSIIGILIGIAIDEGKIKSEKDLVSDYISEWKDDARDKITIEDLLYMQSGLRNEDNSADLSSDIVALYVGTKVEASALKVPAEKEPGQIYEYNNVNTQLLAVLLERATGQALEEYTSSKLWKPLGAAEAGWWMDRKKGMPKAFCCFFAQAEDWLLLGHLILNKGFWQGNQIVSKSWIDKMLTPSRIEQDYGYHIWLNYGDGGRREKDRKSSYLAKSINIDGKNKQRVYIVPEYDLVIVRIGEMPPDWDDSYVVNKVVVSLSESE